MPTSSTPPPAPRSPQRSHSLGSTDVSDVSPETLSFSAKTFMTESKDDEETESNKTSRQKQPSVDVSESEMIRQRRLQRFHSLPVTSSLGSVKESSDDTSVTPDNTPDASNDTSDQVES